MRQLQIKEYIMSSSSFIEVDLLSTLKMSSVDSFNFNIKTY